jgi:transcriptional regulator with XRE-family HTH domain
MTSETADKSLRQLREARGFSLTELARRARMHPSDVSKTERGRAVPYAVQAKRLGRVLGISADQVLTLARRAQLAAEVHE